jgi:lipopolysaccharide transport system ATP-binding protein
MGEYVVDVNALTLDYPTYSVKARSLRYAAARTVGGRLFKDGGAAVVVRALERVSFSLKSGDRLALVGHNGSGKSSLLKVLAGVYEPTSGRCNIDGRVASMLNISQGIDFESSGTQNIRLLSCMRGYSPWRLSSKIEEIVDFAELGAFIDMPVRIYSAGMLARLLFSVATAFDYDVLLLEEWLTAGDADFVHKATDKMTALADKSRVVITATHSPPLVQMLCNKVLHLEHGHVTYFGSMDEYYNGAHTAA